MEIIKGDNDYFTNVERALWEIDPKWNSYNGVIVVGSHKPDRVVEKLSLIRQARENKIPTLGICLGMQLMVIEFAKNVMGWWGANSEEIDPTAVLPIVVKLPKLRVGIFQVKDRQESHWHNYKIEDGFADLLSVYFDTEFTHDFTYGKVLEEMKLRDHPHFVGIQYHPEYQSTKEKPHFILNDFLMVCKKAPTVLNAGAL